jgi:hypothetical protein
VFACSYVIQICFCVRVGRSHEVRWNTGIAAGSYRHSLLENARKGYSSWSASQRDLACLCTIMARE